MSGANIRIGYGYDVHRYAEGRKLILGGITVPSPRGLLGHSDADVLLHAIADALLGAAALRDIGYHFPDTDPRYAGADSMILLREVLMLLRERGYRVGNIDATIVLRRLSSIRLSHGCRNGLQRRLTSPPTRSPLRPPPMSGWASWDERRGWQHMPSPLFIVKLSDVES